MVLQEAWALLLISVAAALLPGISRMVRLPAVVLEILFGMVLGKSGLDLIFTGDWLSFLARLGFLVLMFQAGMEVDFNALRRQPASRLAVQLLVFVATFGLSLFAAVGFGYGVFTALILTTTSLGLVMPTLKDTGIIRTSIGQSALIAATLADFLTLLGITLFVLWHSYGLSWQLLQPVPLFVGFGLLLKAVRLWAWWHPEQAMRLLAARDTQEQGVRMSIALLFLFVALSELVHLEPVLGAFMGGAVLSIVFREKYELEDKLSGIGAGFLIPLFFIHVGMEFDITNIATPQKLLFTLELFLVAVAVKLLPSLILTLNQIAFKDCLKLGMLLSSRLSLIIVAAAIGLEFGYITAAFKDSIVLLAVVTCLIGPVVFKLFYRSGASPEDTTQKSFPKDRLPANWMR